MISLVLGHENFIMIYDINILIENINQNNHQNPLNLTYPNLKLFFGKSNRTRIMD